jgi:hypothetical protein
MESLSIVEISGYGTVSADRWETKNVRGVAVSAGHISKIRIYTYSQCYEPEGKFSWKEYLRTASQLAEALASISDEVGSFTRTRLERDVPHPDADCYDSVLRTTSLSLLIRWGGRF